MAERVVVMRPVPIDVEAALRAEGVDDVWVNPDDVPLSRSRLLELAAGAHGVITMPHDARIDAEFFDAAGPQLRVVSNYAVGVDNIDLEEAARRGIAIGHTPHAVTEPTADIAWLLLLGAARRATEGARLVRSGAWQGIGPNLMLGKRLVGCTLLIVGAGRIGHATARRALGWDMTVLYHARSAHAEFEAAPLHAERVGLDEGLARADIVSLHTPLTPETRHIIDGRRLALMKPDAILVNTARGPVVDEAALVRALRTGVIGAAGLDVFEREPELAPGLAECENAFLLPHLGSATVEDRRWMAEMAVRNVVAGIRGEPLLHAVG